MPSLRRQSDFENLKSQGKFSFATHWLAVSYQANKTGELRWAWTVPKKVGTAVTRNRLKRWGRENLSKHSDHAFDINFIFKPKKGDFYKELSRNEFDQAFQKAMGKSKRA